jgi:two-component system, chemotaxis family, CheB/CheR fusion protein
MMGNGTDPLPDTDVDDATDGGNGQCEGASFPIVGIGASAGGLEAFTQLLKALPADTGMGFVLVQHLAPGHASALAEILTRATAMPVKEVLDGSLVEPNHIYVIPPGQNMVIASGTLQLQPREARGQQRAVDQFFRALALELRHRAIGVVLSGTASDGTLGLEAIKAEGGITFAQDATAQYEGMPHSAVASGCVDFVLSPSEIARELVRIGKHPYAVPVHRVHEPDGAPNFAQIIQLLHQAHGVDFSHYKFNTLYRRVTRRMVLLKMEGVSQYVQVLRERPAEVEALYQDILINVTSFFRDTESFEALKATVFPRLLKGRSRADPVRVWTLGCSTGQEAYSLAMAFMESAEAASSTARLQLFATDLNATGIDNARTGVYSKDIAQDVSPERLRQFFTEVDGGYRISKSIRDACVFSRHNVLADPPFSRIDLISCRNLLIYLEPAVQKKVVPTLHYALKPAGWLWLGGSETIGSYRNLFEATDVKHKIFAKVPGSSPTEGHFPIHSGAAPRPAFIPIGARAAAGAAELPREADRVLLTKFAPPSVLVSSDLEILQYRGDTGMFLAPAPGKASLSLLKMLREGLLVGVRAALFRAGKECVPVREEGLRVKSNGGYRPVAVEVIPLKVNGANESGFLVLFEDAGAAIGIAPPPDMSQNQNPAVSASPGPNRSAKGDCHRVEQELTATREYLQAVIEQQEAANEELQSANEEVQSANEELQSVNEELETSKEEIQSSNEELATVNDELNNRSMEVNRVNSDLVNLLGSVQMAIVMLGPDLRIRRFTPMAEKLLNLTATDVGRPLSDIKLKLDIPELESLLIEVFDTVSVRERDVRARDGRWYSLRLRPYKTLDNKIDGVVMMVVDVDAIKRAEAFTASIVATVREPLVVLDKDLRVRAASRSFYQSFRVTPEETDTRLLYELGNGQWDRPDLRRLLEEVLSRQNEVSDFEVEHRFEHIGARTMLLNARRLVQARDQAPLILVAIEDVTESHTAKKALRESEQRFRALFDLGPVAIYSCDLSGTIREFNRRAVELWGRKPRPGDTDERFCGSHKMYLPDGTFIPHERCPMAEVLSGKIMQARDQEVHIERPDGSRISVIVNIVPLMNERSETTGAINCFYDITERKRLEDELRRSAADLAAADHRKDEFLAMLAHELRGPLAPISNALRVLKADPAEPAVGARVRDMMDRQVQIMTRLIDDLLDVSRISQGKIRLLKKQVDLREVLKGAVESMEHHFRGREQEIEVSLPPEPIYLEADTTRLAQVLGNLLSNASKYNNRGGHVWLTAVPASGGRDDRTDAVVRVRDDGIGIALDQIPHIFELFTQVDQSLDRSQGGLGIGLTLVKNLVEMHGGSVEAHSAGLGRGSEFVVRLPVLAGAAPLEETPADVRAKAQRRRILVVDDNRDSAQSLAMLLRITGHEVQTAYDGLDAVELAAELRPQVVLLDIGLPKLNGYEACRRIREQPWGKEMIVVALTGLGQEEDRRKTRESGFDYHLVKPVDLEALQAMLARLSAAT